MITRLIYTPQITPAPKPSTNLTRQRNALHRVMPAGIHRAIGVLELV